MRFVTLGFCITAMTFAMTAAAFAQDMPLSQVLMDGDDWQLVSQGHKFTEGPAADAKGNVFFTDVPAGKIHRVDAVSGKVTLFADNTANTNGLMFGRDGRLYGCRNGEKQIVAYTVRADGTAGKMEIVADGVTSNDLVVASDGGIYFTDPPNQQVWYVDPKTKSKRIVAKGFRPNGVILTPDEGTLVVTDSAAPHLWAFRVETDGSLNYRDRYYTPLVLTPGRKVPGSDGMTVDDRGRLYVATHAGVQMCDPTGRPSGVILKPQNAFLSNITFGGPAFNVLYATCSDKVYRRKVKPAGRPYFLRGKLTK